jgi:hypothetical protein
MSDKPQDVESPRALSPRPVVVAWLLAVAVDLFFNGGLFSGLFDQAREPSLLPDDVLFRRIPVAYLALLIAVYGLAWLLDRADQRGALKGARVGVLAGLVLASMGIVTLWTAVDVTGLLVAAGVTTQVGEMSASAAVLGAFRAGGDRTRLTRRVLILALLTAVAGIVAQNLLKGAA